MRGLFELGVHCAVLAVFIRALADRNSAICSINIVTIEIAGLWQQRSLNISEHSVKDANSESLVLLLVSFDEKLRGIQSRYFAIPLHKELETLIVLKYRAEAAHRQALDSGVALLNQLKQHLKPVNFEEVSFRSLVTKYRLGETIEYCDGECCLVARLINLLEGYVVTQNFNTLQPTQRFLIWPAFLTHV